MATQGSVYRSDLITDRVMPYLVASTPATTTRSFEAETSPCACQPRSYQLDITHNDRFVDAPLGKAQGGQVATGALTGARIEEAAVLHWPSRTQDLSPRTLQYVVLGIVAEAAKRDRATDRLCLGRDQCIYAATLERSEHFRVGIAGTGSDGARARPV